MKALQEIGCRVEHVLPDDLLPSIPSLRTAFLTLLHTDLTACAPASGLDSGGTNPDDMGDKSDLIGNSGRRELQLRLAVPAR